MEVDLIADKLTDVLGEGAALRYHAGMTNPEPKPKPKPNPNPNPNQVPRGHD